MIQHRAKRFFIHEHSADASSWHDQCVQEVLAVTQTTITKFDQCHFGLMATDSSCLLKPCRKRSKFMSTTSAIDTVFGMVNCAREDMNIFTPQEEKHMIHMFTHLSCAKSLSRQSNLQKKWDARGLKLLATIEAEGKLPAENPRPPEEEAANEILETWDDVSGDRP